MNASAAVNAGGGFRGNEFLQSQHGVIGFQNRVGSVRHSDAHHGAAVEHFLCPFHIALCKIQHVLHRCAHRHHDIAGLAYSIAVHRHHTLHHRHAGFQVAAEECHRGHVHHDHALICRQLSLHDGASQCVIDQHLFCTLRVRGRKGEDLNLRFGLGLFRQDTDRLRLIGFNANDCLGDLQPVQHLPHAVQYFVRCFDHLAVVRGDIGLTLCRVDDQRVHGLSGVQLHVSGEACTAHAHQSAFPHCLEETLFIGDSGRTDIRRNSLFAVGFDLHHGTCPAVGHTVGGNCLDFAGNTGVDRHCHECVGIADLLPHQHGIPRLYKRCTGCTDMHAHGNPHQFRQRQRYRSTVFCVLMVCQMHAMQFLHRIQLLSLFRIALHLWQYRTKSPDALCVALPYISTETEWFLR